MFKLLIAALTSLSLMFGGTEIAPNQPDEPIDNAQEWSVQSWTRNQQQERSADVLPAEEALQTQTRDMIQDQTQDQLCDPIQDQLRDQTQDQLRLHQDDPLHLNPNSGYGNGDGDGICDSDCTPAIEPGQHGNGH